MTVYEAQSSFDPRFIRDLFPGTDTYKTVSRGSRPSRLY
jgi:hypothetical protein